MSDDQTYRAAFEFAQADLAVAERAFSEAQAAVLNAAVTVRRLRILVHNLGALCGECHEKNWPQLGLTEGIRIVLHESATWLTIAQIKVELLGDGVQLSHLKNAGASILSTLNQLVFYNEILVDENTSKQRIWRWAAHG